MFNNDVNYVNIKPEHGNSLTLFARINGFYADYAKILTKNYSYHVDNTCVGGDCRSYVFKNISESDDYTVTFYSTNNVLTCIKVFYSSSEDFSIDGDLNSYDEHWFGADGNGDIWANSIALVVPKSSIVRVVCFNTYRYSMGGNGKRITIF